MNGEGGIGRAEEDLGYLRGDFVTGYDLGISSGGFYPDISLGFLPSLPQTFFELPPLGTGSETARTGDSADEVARDSALPEDVIDPELYRGRTVFESDTTAPTATRTRETDWDWVYEQYVILNAPEEVPVFHGSIDWGEAVGTILGGVLDPFGVGQYARAALAAPTTVTGVPALGQQTQLQPARAIVQTGTGCPPLGPKYAKICLATNEITPLRRRRRRRLLTSSDIKDLAALKAIVGGAALQGAVVQAIRR